MLCYDEYGRIETVFQMLIAYNHGPEIIFLGSPKKGFWGIYIYITVYVVGSGDVVEIYYMLSATPSYWEDVFM